ncbi:hypothetical protein PG996_006187 [Apiospora saccharicola]|uniref:Uncharacterized protein n=1 Tax=Apiospora saccharicola TaxID=335842 RepID=A0ABR1VNK6_9PEZI
MFADHLNGSLEWRTDEPVDLMVSRGVSDVSRRLGETLLPPLHPRSHQVRQQARGFGPPCQLFLVLQSHRRLSARQILPFILHQEQHPSRTPPLSVHQLYFLGGDDVTPLFMAPVDPTLHRHVAMLTGYFEIHPGEANETRSGIGKGRVSYIQTYQMLPGDGRQWIPPPVEKS